jgi:hypothetical protein
MGRSREPAVKSHIELPRCQAAPLPLDRYPRNSANLYRRSWLFAAFQRGEGAGDDDTPDSGSLPRAEMLGQDGVTEDC